MPASDSRPAAQPGRLGRLWWLPSGGIGNGLDDDAWAPILEVTGDQVAPLLAALGEAGVPAYAAPAAKRLGAAAANRPRDYQLWVGSSAHGRAEETLIKALRRVPGRAGRPQSAATR